MKRRVVVTGCGIISSIGNNCEEVLESLRRNRSGIEFIREWEDLKLKSCVAGTIKGIDIDDIRQRIGEKARYMDVSTLYSLLAAEEAIGQSGLTPEQIASENVSCIVGSGLSPTDPVARTALSIQKGRARCGPYDLTRVISNASTASLVYYYGIKGRSFSLSSACATSIHNIGTGCENIWNGISDISLTGGAEEVSPIITAMFDGMRTVLSKAYNKAPEKASRPYDAARDGFVISGGSGILVLEEYEHAIKRGADILCEIIGYGAGSDGFDIIEPHPYGDGAKRCMVQALDMAGLSPGDIDYINPHATSTPAGDSAEAKAIRSVFGTDTPPISSTKSHTGHGQGAAGAIEIICGILMLRHRFIHASINIENLGPEFAGMNIVTENRDADISTILFNSFGFGGTNGSIIIRKI